MNQPIHDDDWIALMRDWRSVDLEQHDNAAEFLAMLLSVKVGAATAAHIGDVYNSALDKGLIKGFAEFCGQIMNAAVIVTCKAPAFLEEQNKRLEESRKVQGFIATAGGDHGMVHVDLIEGHSTSAVGEATADIQKGDVGEIRL